MFAGYLDPQQNKDLWIDIEGSRWLNTGDLGRQDGLGYFWLAGRRKELIIRGGHNIDPKLIEDALSKHPAVAMAAAVGSPDAYAGEVPVAYVQPKPGVAVSDQELMDFAAAHVPERAAIPKLVKIMPSLPVTGIGKIFKPALQQREIEAAVRSEAQNVGATIVDLTFERSPRLGQVVRVRARRRVCGSARSSGAICLQIRSAGLALRAACLAIVQKLREGGKMVTNATGATLVCLGPSSGFEVRPVFRRKPAEIEVAVAAASVNPIDVRRAQGYGRRLLSLVGVGRFPWYSAMILPARCSATMSTRSRSAIGSMA